MDLPTQWMPARTVRDELRAAGIGECDLFAAVASACLGGRTMATGFAHAHDGGRHARTSERRVVSARLWRVFERVDPSFDLEQPEARAAFQRIVRWDRGEFTWTLEQGESRTQETWDSVLFDRPSFELWVAEIRARAGSDLLQDHEIQNWIAGECPTENGKDARALFRRTFGARAGKQTAFDSNWRAVKGNRGRGRPKRQS